MFCFGFSSQFIDNLYFYEWFWWHRKLVDQTLYYVRLMLIILLIIIRSAVLDVIVKGDNFLQIHRCFSGMLKKRQHFFFAWTNAAQLNFSLQNTSLSTLLKFCFCFNLNISWFIKWALFFSTFFGTLNFSILKNSLKISLWTDFKKSNWKML